MRFTSRRTKHFTERFEVRLSADELRQLHEDADLLGLNRSELARRRILQRPIRPATDETMIRELRRLGGLQKHMINKSLRHPEITSECRITFQAIQAAIERVANNDR